VILTQDKTLWQDLQQSDDKPMSSIWGSNKFRVNPHKCDKDYMHIQNMIGCRMDSQTMGLHAMGILDPLTPANNLIGLKWATQAQTISRYVDNGNIRKFINLITDPSLKNVEQTNIDFKKTGFIDMTTNQMNQLVECSSIPQCLEHAFTYNNKITTRQVVVKNSILETWKGSMSDECGVYGLNVDVSECAGISANNEFCCKLDLAVLPLYTTLCVNRINLNSLHTTCNTDAFDIFDLNDIIKLCNAIQLTYKTSKTDESVRKNQVSVMGKNINALFDKMRISKTTKSSHYVQSIDCSIKLYEYIQDATKCNTLNMIYCTDYHKENSLRTNMYYVLDNALQEFPYVWWHVCMFMKNADFTNELSTQQIIECSEWSDQKRIGSDTTIVLPITLDTLLKYDAGVTSTDIENARNSLRVKVLDELKGFTELKEFQLRCIKSKKYNSELSDTCKMNILNWNYIDEHDLKSFPFKVTEKCFTNNDNANDIDRVPDRNIDSPYQYIEDYFSNQKTWLSNYDFLSNSPTIGLLLTEIGPSSILDISSPIQHDAPTDVIDSVKDSTIEPCIELNSVRKSLPCDDYETNVHPLQKPHCDTLYRQYLSLLDMYAKPGPTINEYRNVVCYAHCNHPIHAELHLGLNQHVKDELIKLLDNWKKECYEDATTGLFDYKPFNLDPQDPTSPGIHFSEDGFNGYESSLPELQANGFTIYNDDPNVDEGIIHKMVALQPWHPNFRKDMVSDFFAWSETKFKLQIDSSPFEPSKSWWIDTGNRYLNAAIIRVTTAGCNPSTWSISNARNPNPYLTLSELGQYMVDRVLEGAKWDWMPISTAGSQASRDPHLSSILHALMDDLRLRVGNYVSDEQVNEELSILLKAILGPVYWDNQVIKRDADSIGEVCLPKQTRLSNTDFTKILPKSGVSRRVYQTPSFCFKTKVPTGFFKCAFQNNQMVKDAASRARDNTNKILNSVSKKDSLLLKTTSLLLSDSDLAIGTRYRKTVYTLFISVLKKLTEDSTNGITGKLSSMQMFQDYYKIWESEPFKSFDIDSEKRFDTYIQKNTNNCRDTNNVPVIDYSNCSSEFMEIYNGAKNAFDANIRQKTNVIIPKKHTGIWAGVPFSQHLNDAIPAWSQAFNSGLLVFDFVFDCLIFLISNTLFTVIGVWTLAVDKRVFVQSVFDSKTICKNGNVFDAVCTKTDKNTSNMQYKSVNPWLGGDFNPWFVFPSQSRLFIHIL
jgi:hypothetical protein